MPRGVFKRSEEWRQHLSQVLKGRKLSPERIQQIASYPRTEEWKRNISLGKMGHPVSQETRRKISMVKKGRKYGPISDEKVLLRSLRLPRGPDHPNWKGGIRPLHLAIRGSLRYKKWRMSVFRRDWFTCVLCGDKRGGNLQGDHHPKLFSTILRESKVKTKEEAEKYEEFWDIANGRTLCKSCHLLETKKIYAKPKNPQST